MLNLYKLVTDPDKLKGSYDLACENVPELAWEKYKSSVDALSPREHLWIQSAKLACSYAYYTIKCRWVEAEPVIMKDPYWAYWYAKYLINDRWPEAEPYIMKDPEWVYYYALDVIKGRWLEAEPVIMKDYLKARMYATYVIKDEKWSYNSGSVKFTDPGRAFKYAEFV